MSRRYRTYWRVRQRYRQIGFLSAVLGGTVAAFLIAPLVHSASLGGDPGQAPNVLDLVTPFLAAVILPPLVTWLAWRVHRRRFIDDLYTIPLR